MRIESVTAQGFGALQAQTLTFGPGLNVVCGPNESAKSTWHAAVYSAICGRSRKRGAGTRAQQEFAARYRPWDGRTWEVECVLSLDDGRTIGMHHDLDGQVNCAATDLATGRDLSAEVMYEGSPDASRWLGMNREIFSAIACVRQADILSVLASAGALQEQLEGAATHAGTCDPTAAQAIGIIDTFLKVNVGKDRTNSAKPLRRAIEAVRNSEEELDEARGQHEQYMDLVREAARLRAEVVACEAEVSRLTEREHMVRTLTELTAELNTARERSSALAQRLTIANTVRAQGGDRRPSVADDARALTEIAGALTRWRNLAQPQILTGPDVATLRAQLAALPDPPVGDQRVDPVVAQAFHRLQVAHELAANKKREEPTVPALSQQARTAADVGAVTLRTWAYELERFPGVPAEATPGGQRSVRTSLGLIAAAVAAIAGIGLLVTGSTAPGVALIVLGFVASVLVRARPATTTQVAQDAATAQRQAVQALVEAASLPAQAQALLTLAAEVEHWEQARTRRSIWEGETRAAQTAVHAARRALSDSLALRGVDAADPEAAFTDYEAACERRAQQAALAGRRELLAEQLRARTAAERARTQAVKEAESARVALHTAAGAAGLDTSDPDALQRWMSEQHAEAAALSRRQDAWTRYQRALGDLSHEQLQVQSQKAQAVVSGLEQQVDTCAAQLGPIEQDLTTAWAWAQSSLVRAKNELSTLREVAAIATGKQQDRALTLVSVAEAEERLAAAHHEYARVRALESTLQATRLYLQDAQDTVHRDIAPTLQATLLRWLPAVTDGRYTEAAVDPETLKVAVKTGSGKWVEASRLSVGTAEQVYLLLRVALVIHLSDPLTACPVLLDDVTVQADERRTQALVDALLQVACERQVILFAQEPAIQDWARNHDDVRLVMLEQVPA